MAVRYWVGGAGTWSSSNTANWSATSGGAGGASVPTSADTPTFDANSGSGVVTFTNGAVTVGGITINANNIELRLSAAIISSGSITLTAGTFTTNNYNVTAISLTSSNSNTRTINLGSSTVTVSGTSGIAFAVSTGLAFDAGTSTIICSSGSASVDAGGLAIYDLQYTNTSPNTRTLGNISSARNITVSGRSGTGLVIFYVASNATITGTLTFSAGANATCRTFVQSVVIGSTCTLTCAAVSATDVDFRDIAIAGAAAPVSGTRLGDCKGNSGITFSAPKTVYWNLAGSANNWSAVAWATSAGGAVEVNNFPLAQDTAVFTSTLPAVGATTTINAAWNIGTIDMSARINTMTLATGSQSPTIYGSWINGAGITLTGTGVITFAGRVIQEITSAGKTFTQSIVVDSPDGSFELQDAFICSVNSSTVVVLTSGKFDANGYNVSFTSGNGRFNCSGSKTREVNIGSGTWTIAGVGGWIATDATNLTVTGTGVISLTNTSSPVFNGGGIQTYPTINQGSAGQLIISGSNKFAALTATGIGAIQFIGGTTNEFGSFVFSGTSTARRNLGSSNTTSIILKKPTAWQVGANSINASSSTGVTYTSDGTMDWLTLYRVTGQISSGSSSNNSWAFFALF